LMNHCFYLVYPELLYMASLKRNTCICMFLIWNLVLQNVTIQTWWILTCISHTGFGPCYTYLIKSFFIIDSIAFWKINAEVVR
jgi:hypothetical protein